MLKVVKLPMKKIYHYFYSVNDLVSCKNELFEIDSLFPGEESAYNDVFAFLERQQFDIRRSVVKRLVEYAGRQFNNPRH